jgi:hypothetical protein
MALNSIRLENSFNRWGFYLQYMSIHLDIDHYYSSFDPNFMVAIILIDTEQKLHN